MGPAGTRSPSPTAQRVVDPAAPKDQDAIDRPSALPPTPPGTRPAGFRRTNEGAPLPRALPTGPPASGAEGRGPSPVLPASLAAGLATTRRSALLRQSAAPLHQPGSETIGPPRGLLIRAPEPEPAGGEPAQGVAPGVSGDRRALQPALPRPPPQAARP